MITIPPHAEGLIFDCDGTLADTMPRHYEAWLETVRAAGADFPEPLFYELAGVPSDRIVEILNEKFGYRMNPEQVSRDKEDLFASKHIRHVEPIDPVVAVVKAYHGRLPLSVATGGFRRIAEEIIETVKLTPYFVALVTAHDVTNPKPAIDIYAEAARLMGVSLAGCVVFEDSGPALASLTEAGIAAVDVRPYYLDAYSQGGA